MAIIENLADIAEVVVHWSESEYINEVLGCDDDGDIEKGVDAFAFDSIVKAASKEVGIGYDKTSLSVNLKDGSTWCVEMKFYLTKSKKDLLSLINRN